MPVDPHKLAALASSNDDEGPGGELNIPPISQETDYSCGAAALLSVLRFFGIEDVDEVDLYGNLGTTPERGTAPQDIVRVANARGLRANWRTGVDVKDLQDAALAGVPVILDIQAWEEEPDEPAEHNTDGHYVVLVGIEGDTVHFMDPAVGDYSSMPVDELVDRWHDTDGERGAVFVEGRTNV